MKHVIQIQSDRGHWVDYSIPYDHKSAAGKKLSEIQRATRGRHFKYRLAPRAHEQANTKLAA